MSRRREPDAAQRAQQRRHEERGIASTTRQPQGTLQIKWTLGPNIPISSEVQARVSFCSRHSLPMAIGRRRRASVPGWQLERWSRSKEIGLIRDLSGEIHDRCKRWAIRPTKRTNGVAATDYPGVVHELLLRLFPFRTSETSPGPSGQLEYFGLYSLLELPPSSASTNHLDEDRTHFTSSVIPSISSFSSSEDNWRRMRKSQTTWLTGNDPRGRLIAATAKTATGVWSASSNDATSEIVKPTLRYSSRRFMNSVDCLMRDDHRRGAWRAASRMPTTIEDNDATPASVRGRPKNIQPFKPTANMIAAANTMGRPSSRL